MAEKRLAIGIVVFINVYIVAITVPCLQRQHYAHAVSVCYTLCAKRKGI